MKKELLKSIKIIALGLTIGLSVSFVYASWQEPPSFAPSKNVQGPINVGTTDQVKDGGLSVNNFIALMNSELVQGIKISSLADSNAFSNSRPLCLDKDGNVKVCGVDIFETHWGTAIWSPDPHEGCRVNVISSGGTPGYTYTWKVNGVIPHNSVNGSTGSTPYLDVHKTEISNTGFTLEATAKDSTNPNSTITINGSFSLGGQATGGGSN